MIPSTIAIRIQAAAGSFLLTPYARHALLLVVSWRIECTARAQARERKP
jgi:hypothetical protein